MARDFYDKNTLDSYIKVKNINSEQMEMLKTNTSKVKFSMENMIKNRINHAEVNIYDYEKIDEIIASPDKIIPDGEYHIKLFIKYDNKIYETVIKTTKDRKEVFFSFSPL